MDIFTV